MGSSASDDTETRSVGALGLLQRLTPPCENLLFHPRWWQCGGLYKQVESMLFRAGGNAGDCINK